VEEQLCFSWYDLESSVQGRAKITYLLKKSGPTICHPCTPEERAGRNRLLLQYGVVHVVSAEIFDQLRTKYQLIEMEM